MKRILYLATAALVAMLILMLWTLATSAVRVGDRMAVYLELEVVS